MLKGLLHETGCVADRWQGLRPHGLVDLRFYSPRPATLKLQHKTRIATLCNSSSVSTLYKTYRSAPDTAKVAFRTGIYIALFGLGVLIAPKTALQFLGFQLR